MLRVEALLTERNPLFWCIPREIVLRKIRPIVGRSLVIVNDGHVTSKATASQHLRGRRAGGASSNDDDVVQGIAGEAPGIVWSKRVTLGLLTHQDAAAPALDLPAGN